MQESFLDDLLDLCVWNSALLLQGVNGATTSEGLKKLFGTHLFGSSGEEVGLGERRMGREYDIRR